MKKNLILTFSLITIFFSCNQDKESIPDSRNVESDPYFVNILEAKSIAILLEYEITQPGTQTKSVTSLEIENIVPMGGSTEKPSYYIANYKDNSGFAIIAADTRTEYNILAFSTESGFNTETTNIPQGLIEWMIGADNYITNIRELNIEEPVRTKSDIVCDALKSTSSSPTLKACYNTGGGNGCPASSISTEVIGPLLSSKWHQGSGFNNFAPIVCNGNKAPAGCVPIAVAQVMKYHQHAVKNGQSYNWLAMDPMLGGPEASRLISDISDADNLNVKYGCSASNSNMANSQKTFKNFGYSHDINIADFQINIIKSQLKAKQPVILSGRNDEGGHEWVCDGFEAVNTCKYSTLRLHMNWGWGAATSASYETPDDYNGWYAVGDDLWKPRNTSDNYKDNHRMLYNIVPKK